MLDDDQVEKMAVAVARAIVAVILALVAASAFAVPIFSDLSAAVLVPPSLWPLAA
jgi:hypothetical protein